MSVCLLSYGALERSGRVDSHTECFQGVMRSCIFCILYTVEGERYGRFPSIRVYAISLKDAVGAGAWSLWRSIHRHFLWPEGWIVHLAWVRMKAVSSARNWMLLALLGRIKWNIQIFQWHSSRLYEYNRRAISYPFPSLQASPGLFDT